MEISAIYKDSKSFTSYNSSDRDIRIFNEDQSRMVSVHFKDAITKTFRFLPDGSLNEERHMHAEKDMFRYKNKMCDRWGDMTTEYLPTKHIEYVMLSIKHNVFKGSRVDDLNNLLNELTLMSDPKTGKDAEKVKKPAAIGVIMAELETRLIKPLTNALCGTEARDFTSLITSSVSTLCSADPKIVWKDLNSDNIKRFDSIISAKTTLEKIMIIAFLFSSLHADNFIKMHENDVYFPIDIVIARPYMTYNMSSVVIMKSGTETGETYIGHQDFNMSSNTQLRVCTAP